MYARCRRRCLLLLVNTILIIINLSCFDSCSFVRMSHPRISKLSANAMDLVFMDWGTYSLLGNDAEGLVGVGGPAAGSPACGRPLEQKRKVQSSPN
jgi:hypothetical protein